MIATDTETGRGHEARPREPLILPLCIAGAALLALGAWILFAALRPQTGSRTFESATLGCRFEYSPALTAGPNYVRTHAGSFLTVERHSLTGARKDFVAALPDVLFPQVMIQLDQSYRELEELSRGPVTIAGRRGLEVVLKGKAGTSSSVTVVTVDIVHNEDWVYVFRAYSPEKRAAADRPEFERVRASFAFLAAPGVAPPS